MGRLLGGVVLALLPMPRGVRHRLRLRSPGAARAADRISAAALPAIVVATLALLGVALWPHTPGGVPRLWPAGGALGLATGIPFALDRRRLRGRAVGIPVPEPPSATGPHTTAREAGAAAALDRGDLDGAEQELAPLLEGEPTAETLRLGALAAARRGDGRRAQLRALQAARLDRSRWDVLTETGWVLCRRGRFSDGIRLLERGAELSGRERGALLTLAAGQAVAGRLREAATTLDEVEALSGARRC